MIQPSPFLPISGPEGEHTPEPYLTPATAVAESLGVNPAWGLDETEVARRRERIGENRLAEQPRRSGWLRFLDQFRSLLILILLGAAVLAGVVGELKDTIVILVVLLINATVGFVQENRAEHSLEALRDMLVPTARVRREGAARVVDATELVPGDLVLLEPGDRVPADGRLIVAQSVEVNESALTGESLPVAKDDAPVSAAPGEKVPLADRTGMAYLNTTLTRGRAELVVTATGMQTEVGSIAALLSSGVEPQTPLQIQLDSLGKRISAIGGISIALYVIIASFRGEAPGDLALSAVALVVATVPEGLPAVLALTLALGVARMARRGAIVKRLASVETLGSATVICTDKTGTLTLNEMTVRALVLNGSRLRIDGEGYLPHGAIIDESTGQPAVGAERLLEPLVLCSDATLTGTEAGDPAGIVGDPTEGALVVAAAKAGIDAATLRVAHPRVAELPFDSARKFMATAHDENGRVRVYIKGAPDILLARSTALITPDGVRDIDAADRARLAAEVSDLASGGLRVLAAATTLTNDLPADGDRARASALEGAMSGLTLLGLVGIADPPRPQVRDAIALAHRAGISVKMITGDHRDTASAIAEELGIRGDVVTGTELDQLTTEQLSDRVESIGVFARVAPEHKVAIVRALTARGHVTAMTGDGVNDAAALRSAHMGVAMGITGTEVTKEAGDMILTDDDFTTIVASVREGRSIYDNVVKFVRFQLSTNIGAILAFLGATLAGLAPPLTAIQVLWVNIIMDGPPAMALGVDRPRPGLMDEQPRRSDERILSGARLFGMVRAGATMAIGTLSVLALGDTAYGGAVATTMAFTTFVLFQFFNALNSRAERQTVFTRHLFTNRWLWISFATVLVLQVFAVQLPFLQGVFDTAALSVAQWLICLATASSVLVIEETIKLVRWAVSKRAI